jgi:hypothetical protein
MARKTICDRCKSESDIFMNIFEVPNHGTERKFVDLCRDCNSELIKTVFKFLSIHPAKKCTHWAWCNCNERS